jgi:PEP-CTERM putative exosortase interaction domain
LDIAPQQLTGTRTSSVYGPTYSWNYSYHLSFQNDTLLAQVGVELVGADPGTALRNQWESGVESTWSNHYDVVDGTYLYPILLDLVWVGSSPDETVTVHAGTGGVDMLNWYTTNPSGYPNSYQGVLAAHEVGHMIGLYDEYYGGAVDPATQFQATNALMADLGPVQQRYYLGMLGWLEGASGRDLALVSAPEVPEPSGSEVPEPSTIALAAIGLLALFVLRRKSVEP